MQQDSTGQGTYAPKINVPQEVINRHQHDHNLTIFKDVFEEIRQVEKQKIERKK